MICSGTSDTRVAIEHADHCNKRRVGIIDRSTRRLLVVEHYDFSTRYGSLPEIQIQNIVRLLGRSFDGELVFKKTDAETLHP